MIEGGYAHVVTKSGKYYKTKFTDATRGELKIEAEEKLLV